MKRIRVLSLLLSALMLFTLVPLFSDGAQVEAIPNLKLSASGVLTWNAVPNADRYNIRWQNVAD